MIQKLLKTILCALAALSITFNTAFAQKVHTYETFPEVKNLEAEQITFQNMPYDMGYLYLTDNNLTVMDLDCYSEAIFYVLSYPDLEFKGKFGNPDDYYAVRLNPAFADRNGFTLTNYTELRHIAFEDSEPVFETSPIDSILTDIILLKDGAYCMESDFEDDYEMRFYAKDGSFKKVGEFPEPLEPRFSNNYERYYAYAPLLAGKPDGERMAMFYKHTRRFKIYDCSGELISDNILKIKPGTDKPLPDEEKQILHPESIFTTDHYIYVLNNDNTIVYTGDEEPMNIQVFDWDGKPVKRLILPDYIHLRSIVVDERRQVIIGCSPDELYKFRIR